MKEIVVKNLFDWKYIVVASACAILWFAIFSSIFMLNIMFVRDEWENV